MDQDHKAAQELARVLAPGGNLFLAVPVGRPRLCFNAHRIHLPEAIPELFSRFSLVEFSGVTDQGEYVPDADPDMMSKQKYGGGLFWLRR